MIKKIIVTKETHPGVGRSEARNIEAFKTTADCVVFMDDDGYPESSWRTYFEEKFKEGYSIVAGREIRMGKTLPRVPIYIKGQDISYPACFLGFKTDVFRFLGGFDETFDYAEDIDLLYRGVQAGFKIGYAKKAIFFHLCRATTKAFLSQSFWYGYGRAQLEKKHGPLLKKTVMPKLSFWMTIRLFFGALGYIYGKSR